MSNKLQIRRGTKAALDMITLAAGELGWTSDTKGLYIGDGATNKLYATEYIDWSATGAEQIHADRLSGILSGVLLADGTIPLTANWNIGNFKLGINTSPSYPLHLSHTPGDENFKQIRGYASPSGTLTAAYDHYGVHEVINSFINRGTYQYNIYGGYFSAGMTGGSASTVNGLCGEFSCGSSPAIQVGRAMYAANSVTSAGISEVDGLYSFTLFSFSGECATAYGLRSTISLNTSGTVSNAYGVHAYISQSSGTLTTGYLFYGHYSGTVGTKWGIYLDGETKNYFSGQVGIKETTPAADLDIAGTLILLNGTSINEFSTDGTLAGDSDDAVPTEKAVKTYVDATGGVTDKILEGDSNVEVIDTGTGQIDFDVDTTRRAMLNASGLQLGETGPRIASFVDEDDMSSNSATRAPTQQSVKAYVDGKSVVPTGMIVAWPLSSVPSGFLECNGSLPSMTGTFEALYDVIGHSYGFESAINIFTADYTSNTITRASHGLIENQIIELENSGGALPAGLLADTKYFVVSVLTDTFQVSLTSGGAAVGFTDNGTGTHRFYTRFKLPDMRGEFLRGYDHGIANDPDAASRTDRGDGTTGDNVGTKQADEFKAHTHALRRTSDNTIGGSGVRVRNNGTDVATGGTGGNETRARNIYVMWCIKF